MVRRVFFSASCWLPPIDLPADLKKDAEWQVPYAARIALMATLADYADETADRDTIEKTGCDGHAGVAATELPRPVADEGARQTLRIAMPWPSSTPKAPLFVLLRGETEGRATKVQP